MWLYEIATHKAWTLQECYKHVLLAHYVNNVSNIYQPKVTLRSYDMSNNSFRWTLQEHYEHVSLEHYINNISNAINQKLP